MSKQITELNVGRGISSATLDGVPFNNIQWNDGQGATKRRTRSTQPWNQTGSTTISDFAVNAVDIDWNGAQVGGTSINTTGELLSLIGNSSEGAQGAKGAQGPTGAQGIKGQDGGQGAQGPTGAQGIKGQDGGQGAQGAQGIKGAQGIAGSATDLSGYVTTSQLMTASQTGISIYSSRIQGSDDDALNCYFGQDSTTQITFGHDGNHTYFDFNYDLNNIKNSYANEIPEYGFYENIGDNDSLVNALYIHTIWQQAQIDRLTTMVKGLYQALTNMPTAG